MSELRATLNRMGVAWRDMSAFGRERTLYAGPRGTVAVIAGADTYGGSDGLLEAWNPGEAHDGWLTACEVVDRFPPKRGHACTRA